MNEVIYLLIGFGCFAVGGGLLLGCAALIPVSSRAGAKSSAGMRLSSAGGESGSDRAGTTGGGAA